MAIDTSEDGNGFEELRNHIGHAIACVGYGKKGDLWNVAIECEDCSEVLLSFDHPDMNVPKGMTLNEIKNNT